MDASTKRGATVLLRRPLPPSETYKLSVNTTRCSTTIKTSSGTSNQTRSATLPLVPANTPYKNNGRLTCSSNREIHIHPLYPKGPPPLPPSKILSQGIYREEDDLATISVPEFTFNDFLLSSDHEPVDIPRTHEVMLSRENYLKMTSWFVTQKPTQNTFSSWLGEIDLIEPEKRIPEHQLFIEFRAILKELSKEESVDSVHVQQQPSTDTQHSSVRERRSTLPVLVATSSEPDDVQHNTSQVRVKLSKDDVLIQSSTSRFFCGEGRSRSPFDSSDQPLASPGEVAILSTIVCGGTHLSLKAHFLTELPLLTPLSSTLSHLNLSYNGLQVFPTQLLELHELVCLRLRNNPIKEIPSGIKNLTKLDQFSISFNLLSDLPPGLFELYSLRKLDVSHNYLQLISRDIARLRNLKKLNVECNQLVALPATLLSLSLTELRVDGNYFHPALWRENTNNQPQTLKAMCCRVAGQSEDDQYRDITQSCDSGLYCDECNGRIYGKGLRLIRSNGQEQVFKHKCLPLMFQVCSPSCHRTLKTCHEIIWNSECKIIP